MKEEYAPQFDFDNIPEQEHKIKTCKQCGKSGEYLGLYDDGICFECKQKNKRITVSQRQSVIPKNEVAADYATKKYLRKSKIAKGVHAKMKFEKKAMIAIALILIPLIFFVAVKRHNTPKIAENRVAYYMSQKTNDFLSFGKVYDTVSLKGFGYTVELSGTVNVSVNNGYKTIKKQFTAEVYVPLFGKTRVREITENGNRVY